MADVRQETGVVEEARKVGDLGDEAERAEVEDVGGTEDVGYVEEDKDEACSVGRKEVGAEEEDIADLNETREVEKEKDVADLARVREVVEEEVADLTGKIDVVKKEDVADLVGMIEVAKQEVASDLAEMRKVAEGDVDELAETTEVAMKVDVADMAEMREVAEGDVDELAETTEVATKVDVADLAEMREVAAREVAEEEVGADMVEMMEVAEEDVYDLAEMREVVEEEDVAKLAEIAEVTKEEDVAELAEMGDVAKEEVVADLAEMKEVAKENVADLVEMREVAKEDVSDLPEMVEAAEKEDVAKFPETYLDGQAVEDADLLCPIAEETDLAAPVAAETDLAHTVGEEGDLAGPVTEETDLEKTSLGGHVDEMEEPADEANVVDMANETMEAEEDLAEQSIEGDEIEAIEVTEMAEETVEAEEIEAAEEMEVVEASKGSGGGKRKRGKNSRAPARVPKKKVEEDVCFICFDGGDLVLCDRRGCPKAYHPSCVNRDEAFFRAKGRWNCGWHLCSNCEKSAFYMCYTCTFSLCKACIKDSVILCVRGNKGFCETCMKTVTLIEHNLQGNKDMGQVDFDDKSSWEYLFKDYWIDLKERLSLTLEELNKAKNPWKLADVFAGNQESPDELYDANNDEGSDSENSGNIEISNSKRKRAKKRLRPRSREADSPAPATETGAGVPSTDDHAEWASKELLEFVSHMQNGDRSVLSQFDVQALLLEYIKRNKLRDPRRKSQIICDSRLQSLFGKPRVGHFEMLKLLESHFLIKEDSQIDDLQGSVVDTEASQLEADGTSDAPVKTGREKKRKTRKKGDERGSQSNVDDYAAIDIHNINLIYLRRNLVEELLEDMEKFNDKVIGSFVRIRISGSGQKQDLYRLVQVVGTCKAAEPYKVGKRMTEILLEILNLNKKEMISTDIISNQEFTEDECKRLRQSIKCGLINRLTVGDIQERAIALQEVRVKDWLETEIVRLSHLRDRASETGRRKELRECVEKLQLLKTPEERQRRLEEIPEIHADPHMDPSYESEEDEGETDDKRKETYMRPRGTGFGRRAREPVSPQPGGPAFSDTWSGTRNYSNINREFNRSMSNKELSYKGDDTFVAGEIPNDRNQGRDIETPQSGSWEKQKIAASLEIGASKVHSVQKSDTISCVLETSAAALSTTVAQSAATINETEKMWHYQDPSGKIQGPFSMVQLRKWNNTGYFPANLKIWRTTERQDDSILLTDALAGKFLKDPPLVHNSHSSLGSAGGSWRSPTEISPSAGRHSTLSVEVPKTSTDGWGSNYRNDSTNLPSPTPIHATTGAAKGQPYESKWLHNPVQSAGSVMGAGTFSGANGGLQPPAAVIPEIAVRGSESNGASSHPGVNPVPKASSILADASMSPVADLKNIGTNFHNLDRSVANHNRSIETQGWGSGLVPKPEMTASCLLPGSESQACGSAPSQKVEPNNPATMPVQPLAHGHWADAPFIHNSAPSFSSGNPVGNIPAAGFSGNQSNIHPPAQPTQTWGMGVAENLTTSTRPGPENQNTGWGPLPGNPNMGWAGPGNHNMGWGGQVPANANINWGGAGQGPAPGNATAGWAAPVQAPGNAVPGWVPASQGTLPLGNVNPGWVAPGQGPPPGNANPGWVAPTGNPSNNADRFTNQSVRGSHGGDSVYCGSKAWNRQSSFGGGGGGGGSRPTFKGQRVCKFHESGHCKKGASCDYLHP